jgi:hypothetical protein
MRASLGASLFKTPFGLEKFGVHSGGFLEEWHELIRVHPVKFFEDLIFLPVGSPEFHPICV